MIGVVVVPAGFEGETRVAGLAPVERHRRALVAAGASRVLVLEAAEHRPPAVGDAHAALGPLGAENALIVRADVACHRLLLEELAREEPRRGEVLEMVGAVGGVYRTHRTRASDVVHALCTGAEVLPTAARAVAQDRFLVAAGTAAERARATKLHLTSLTKHTAGPLDRAWMRRVSQPIALWLAPTRVTPNEVTLFTIATGVLAALLVAQPAYAMRALGALLLVLVRLLDCVDGDLARLRHEQSRFGEWLDTVGDAVGLGAFVWGAAAHVGEREPLWLVVGLIATLGWSLAQALALAELLRTGARGSLQAIEWGHRRPGPKSWFEQLVRVIEPCFRIDVISVLYAALVLVAAGKALVVLHGAASFVVAGYFLAQTLAQRARVDASLAR